ncbi:MAG: putative molybdenum carrier protein [Bacteroidales bacterium]|nr:putative molybdenum carrier protein [Bacteroidales bacterium]
MNISVRKIISGGQTGVDRAALDFALRNGIICGGWCPRGRKAEDGTIPEKYPLNETASDKYPPRTEANIKESDGTLILMAAKMDSGTLLTVKLCKKHEKPYFLQHIPVSGNTGELEEWLISKGIATLNIAGPRESFDPGIYGLALDYLETGLHLFMHRNTQHPLWS